MKARLYGDVQCPASVPEVHFPARQATIDIEERPEDATGELNPNVSHGFVGKPGSPHSNHGN
jgi:hypothetical protein